MKPPHYILALAVAALYLATKWWILSHFRLDETLEVIPGFFRIRHVTNSGVAFGMLQDLDTPYKPFILSGIALAALAAIIYYGRQIGSAHKWLLIALAVVMGGILGNFIDRVYHHSVVDFIELYWGQYRWPTFNVADSAISVGITFLLLDSFRAERTPS